MLPTPSSGGSGSAEAVLAPARDRAITPTIAMLQVFMASPFDVERQVPPRPAGPTWPLDPFATTARLLIAVDGETEQTLHGEECQTASPRRQQGRCVSFTETSSSGGSESWHWRG